MSLLFVDVFHELTDKITQFISNICLSYSILYLLSKFHRDIPNKCQEFANLLLWYFNLDYLNVHEEVDVCSIPGDTHILQAYAVTTISAWAVTTVGGIGISDCNKSVEPISLPCVVSTINTCTLLDRLTDTPRNSVTVAACDGCTKYLKLNSSKMNSFYDRIAQKLQGAHGFVNRIAKFLQVLFYFGEKTCSLI